jgi:hypothetical protein
VDIIDVVVDRQIKFSAKIKTSLLTLSIMNPNLIAPNDTQLKLPKLSTIDLLQTWIDGEDAEDQKETGDYLVQTLDQDRSSRREFFPAELEGVTW